MPALIDRIAASRYVSLTTFRKIGVGVATPVWIAREPGRDTLIVITSSESGKGKRLRRNPNVELRPSDVRGRVPKGARMVSAKVETVRDADEIERLAKVLEQKYGLLFRLYRFVEGKIPHEGSDVILRITLDPKR